MIQLNLNFMKNALLILSFLIGTTLSLFAQSTQEPILDSETITYDSVMHFLNRKDVSFLIKYNFFHDNSGNLNILERINIFKKLIPEAKKEADKQYVIKLYSNLQTYTYAINGNQQEDKPYLDTALTYVNQTKDPDALGYLYFRLGHYYSLRYDSTEIAHTYLYKSIPYLKESKQNHYRLNSVYFLLASYYQRREDMEALGKIIPKMLELKLEGPHRVFYMNIYDGVANYYSTLRVKDSINAPIYLDSVIYYRRKIVNIYETLKDSVSAIHESSSASSMAYMALALELSDLPNPDWNEVMIYLEKGKSLIQPSQGSYTSEIRYFYHKGVILHAQKKHNEAIIALKEAEKLLEENESFDATDEFLLRIYESLTSIYSEIANYRLALEYEQKAVAIRNKLNDQERLYTLKELEVKHETAEKELEISRLNEEQQRILYNRTIMIGGFILLTILLVIGILYGRVKRLRKEKEALELAKRIEQKEVEYQDLEQSVELSQMRHYLGGLEAERNRLAKELHDNVSNHIYMIDSELNKLENIPDDIHQQTEALYNQVRSISHELIPPTFRNTSFIEIIANYLFVQEKQSNINFELSIQDEEIFNGISPKISLELYRIIQEATSNIIKHASATQAKVNLSYEGEQITLEIIDNGKGFDISKKHTGIGLHILKDRTQSLEGHLQIDSTPGAGTKITVRISIPTQSTDDE